MPYWGDGVFIWHHAASDIVKEQALEEAIQKRTNLDAMQTSGNPPWWAGFPDTWWPHAASDIVEEQAQASEESTQENDRN